MHKLDNSAFLIEVERRLKRKYYKEMKTSLKYANPFELLISTVLSAQTTDKQVNIVTKRLFDEYGTAMAMAQASPSKVRSRIKSIGFYRNKTIEDLVSLPGIGRKTANTILINAYGIVEGIPVDTWVIKLSLRLGLSLEKNPEKIEKDLMDKIDKKYWHNVAYVLKRHGKTLCKNVPECSKCPVNGICPRNSVTKAI